MEKRGKIENSDLFQNLNIGQFGPCCQCGRIPEVFVNHGYYGMITILCICGEMDFRTIEEALSSWEKVNHK